MSDVVIEVQNVSKQYRLGQIGGGSLREDLHRWWERRRARGTESPVGHAQQASGKDHWALTDISFNVRQGEVLGIVGRNGAGKSTLLKILSRTTAPTGGRIRIRGRVGSLLEVGTGFHPELSGRENIYLNGAILGMRKAEIDAKLDEIIAFSAVEKFIDTPVKRYSSGMYIRLAFAVAAHLEPEILVVDEVLAVGDAAFQQKCLGKMQSLSGQGRTVLFVSHSTQAIQSLCTRCILLSGGEITVDGPPSVAIQGYLSSPSDTDNSQWSNDEGLGDDRFRLRAIRVMPRAAVNKVGMGGTFLTSDDLIVRIEFWMPKPLPSLCVGFDLMTGRGEVVLRTHDTDSCAERRPVYSAGLNQVNVTIPKRLLNAGQYAIAPRISLHNQEWLVACDPLVSFSELLAHGESEYWNSLGAVGYAGVIAPILPWQACPT